MDEMTVKYLLREEIKKEIEELGKMEFGSEQHKAAGENVARLLDKLNEMEKNEIEFEENVRCRQFDIDLKREQMEFDKKDRFTKNVITAVSVGGSLILMVWGTNKAMLFEKEDTFTSTVGRGWINKITSLIKIKS